MRQIDIIAVEIDQTGRLCIKPDSFDFAYIYRAAMEVTWDAEIGLLLGPTPRELPYARWFRQIRMAAADEYRVNLRLTPTTTWTNVPDDLRLEITGNSE